MVSNVSETIVVKCLSSVSGLSKQGGHYGNYQHELSRCVSREIIRINAAIVLGSVGNLSVFTPSNLSSGCDDTEFRYVDFDDCTLRKDTELRVERVLRVFLDGKNGQLDGDGHFGAKNC